ncbi:IS30 family transposase [Megamonas funiformis]|uniref:IS30 family transposase n=1 Tax=Megamonas funiformis TaxID=437897 RepID=UPI0022E7DD2C|nr:IS30 family transposase [Megamonas funiformis]
MFPLSFRPKDVKSRRIFGQWELDTIISSSGKSKACLATFIERKTKFYVVIKIKDRTVPSMLKAIKKLVKVLPKKALKTFTTDRRKEFACYKEVEKLILLNSRPKRIVALGLTILKTLTIFIV